MAETEMHQNPAFRGAENTKSLDFVRTRGFGTIAVNSEPAPLLAHIPVRLTNNDQQIEFHLMRSNPIARLLKTPMPAVVSLTGPDSYISPDWYGIEDQVPTWNYVAVHLRGTIELLPQKNLRGILDRLSDHFESLLAPKPVWKSEKMTPDILDRMMRMVVPCRMSVDDIQSTWKLGQNKSDDVRLAAADHVADHGIGQESRKMSELMRSPPKS